MIGPCPSWRRLTEAAVLWSIPSFWGGGVVCGFFMSNLWRCSSRNKVEMLKRNFAWKRVWAPPAAFLIRDDGPEKQDAGRGVGGGVNVQSSSLTRVVIISFASKWKESSSRISSLKVCIWWHCNPLCEPFWSSTNLYLSQINLITGLLNLVGCRTPMELLFSAKNCVRSSLVITFCRLGCWH